MIRLMPVILLFCAAPAVAFDPPAASEPTEKAEKKICRSDRSTGSIMPKKRCHTKAEWDAIKAEMQAQLDRNPKPDGNMAMPTQQ